MSRSPATGSARMPGRRRRVRVAVVSFLTMALAGLVVPALAPTAAVAAIDDKATDSAVTITKDIVGPDAGRARFTVSKTKDLRRETVRVSWSGLRESIAGENANGYFDSRAALDFKYTVAVFQCTGTDPDRTQCFRARGGLATPDLTPASTSRRAPQDAITDPGVDTYMWDRPGDDPPGLVYTLADGTRFLSELVRPECDPGVPCRPIDTMPDDYPTYPGNAMTGRTMADGTGYVDFEVRTGDEAPQSLGCGRVVKDGQAPVKCSLVIVPITRPECANSVCERRETSDLKAPDGYNANSAGWASHWRNRVVVPLEFGPADGVCPLTSAARTPVAGSEVAGEAMYRWVGGLCLGDDPTVMTYSPRGEGEARRQYASKVENAVLVSQPMGKDETGGRPTAYAPVSLGGFAVAFKIDDPDDARAPIENLRLTPRLVAKLITQSYRGTLGFYNGGSNPTVLEPPYLAKNPLNLSDDPEFQKYNPEVGKARGGGAPEATMMLPSADGDVPRAVFDWLLADRDAAAFLKGEPDEWGMTINPAYKGWKPGDQFEWRDQYRFPTTVTRRDYPTPVYNDKGEQIGTTPGPKTHTCASEDMNPSNEDVARSWYDACQFYGRSWGEANAQRSGSLSRISNEIVIGRPMTTTRQEETIGRRLDNYVRDSAQEMGQRWTIGLTDLASARRFGLNVAELASPSKDGSATFAAPSTVSMAAAVSTMNQDKATGLLEQDYSSMVAGAYPGTMLQYLALPTSGLDKDLAKTYAGFVRYATTTGQKPGTVPGTLPEGYVPLPAAFRAQAATIADAVEAQKGAVPVVPVDPKNPDTLTTGGGSDTPTGGGALPGGTAPGGASGSLPSATTAPGAAGAVPAGTTPSAAPKGRTVAMPESLGTTRGEKGGWTKWVFPGVLLTGLLAGVGIPFGLVTGQPGHPVRVVGSQLLRDVGHVLRIRRT